MKFHSVNWSVDSTIKYIKNQTLDLAPEYQRGPVWARARQASLVDSIIRGYDLPKFYVRRIANGDAETFEVVDGLQRLTSLVNFLNNDFPLPKDSKYPGVHYDKLPVSISQKLDAFQLTFTVLEDFSDSEVSDMFLRLQNGLKLNAAEELNAISGDMHNYIEDLSKSAFFDKTISFGVSRGAARHVAAQLATLAVRGYGDVRKQDLKRMYVDFSTWKPTESAKALKQVLNWLAKTFDEKDVAFRNRGQTISIVMVTMDLWQNYFLQEKSEEFSKAIHGFDIAVQRDDPGLREYATAISHSSDQGKSIELRREIMLAYLQPFTSQLEKKDVKRTFSMPDRVLAWYAAAGKCQYPQCATKITFQDFHADHLKAWSKGGQTKLSNLQVLCKEHNLKKGKKDI